MNYADLHIHSTFSDGSLSPKEIIHYAKDMKLKAISITDHDTVDAIDTSISIGKEYGIEVIPGIEINTTLLDEEIHILGYCFDYKNKKLLKLLNILRNSRYDRAKKIINKLNKINIDINIRDVVNIAECGIGRPHIARVMIDKGYIKDMKEAFDKYIGKGRPAYVERYRLTPKEVIKTIKMCGGVSVLAHPGIIKNQESVDIILNYGIDGIEVYHPNHNEIMNRKYYYMAESKNLIITGGSDCHGINKNSSHLIGKYKVSYDTVNIIKEKSIYWSENNYESK